MLLILMNEWFGPSRARMQTGIPSPLKPELRLRSFATRLPLAIALARIRAYEVAYNAQYREVTALNFTLLTVSVIDELDSAYLLLARIDLVEELPQSTEEINQ